MKFFKNRAVAVIIALVVVLGGATLSAKTGLDRAVREVELLYYSGVEHPDDNYTRKSIDSQMRIKFNTLNSILAITSGYDSLADISSEAVAVREHIYANLGTYNTASIPGMSAANGELEALLPRLEAAIAATALTAREQEMVETCLSDLAGAQRVIQSSGYNEAVREFNGDEMSKFPARLLLPLFGNDQGGASYFA